MKARTTVLAALAVASGGALTGRGSSGGAAADGGFSFRRRRRRRLRHASDRDVINRVGMTKGKQAFLGCGLLLLAACAHSSVEPDEPPADGVDPCRAVRLAEQRYRDAARACAPYSRETFNWHDCMIANKVQPAPPPPYYVDDGPDCHDRRPSLKSVAE